MPRDIKSNPPGIYTGNVQVLLNGKVVREIPLVVTLLPYYLPDENRSTVWVFSGDMYPYFPELSEKEVDGMIKFEGHRHRIDMTGGFTANSAPFDPGIMTDYKPYLDGAAYTLPYGYHGNGEGIGDMNAAVPWSERLFLVRAYGLRHLL